MRILLNSNLLYILLLLQSCGIEKIEPGPPEEIIVDPGYITQFFVTDLKVALNCENAKMFEYVKARPVVQANLPQFAEEALSMNVYIEQNEGGFLGVSGLKYLLRIDLEWDTGNTVTLTFDDYPLTKIVFTLPSTSGQKPKMAFIENAHLLFEVDLSRTKSLTEDQRLHLANTLPPKIQIEYFRAFTYNFSYDAFDFINGCHEWRSKDF